MDEDALRELLADQDGVVARRQLVALGVRRHDLDRLLRRRELTRVLSGVYLDHTGAPSWQQRAWAAVLYAAPAALCGRSALPSPDPDRPIQVAIDASRRLADLGDLGEIRFQRRRGLERLVQWNASPPRVRYDVTVLDLVDRADTDLDVIRVLTDAVNDRHTTASRLRAALDDRPRLRRRRWVLSLVDDLESGACSVLEHRYLTDVERAHRLPGSSRQVVRLGAHGREYRDVEYDLGLVVELDGQLAHESFNAGGRDAERDLDDVAAGRDAVRLRWRQVVGTPCRTAAQLAVILQRRGWTGAPQACGPGCVVGDA